jgi:hypothetical protein
MFQQNFSIWRVSLLLAFVLSGINVSFAQIDAASVTGQVTDATGAVLPGAKIVATSQATNIAVETMTNSDGYYTLTNLRPSFYTIEITLPGFRTETRKSFELNVGQRARLDFQLSVGEATAVVDVTTENQSLIQREDASLGNVVDNRRVSTLPLPQRSWDDF